jgi:hypothetical protein|tara:strand:- start:16 stop:420 length:405 start_codon:yes stop_codon:yes gene_type:complete
MSDYPSMPFGNPSAPTWRKALDVAEGKAVPITPTHYIVVQLWLAWRMVQYEIQDDTNIVTFAADCNATAREVTSALTGTINSQKFTMNGVIRWARAISDAWKDRGVSYELWIVVRPDGTGTVIPRKLNQENEDA